MVIAPDPVEIQDDAVRLPVAEVARYLQDTLGQRMVAYLSGIKDPKMIGAWAAGNITPRTAPDMRLRCAYQVTRLIEEAYDRSTAKAWLFGSNARLDDEAPAYLMRHARDPEGLRFIVPAARAFAGGAL